MRHTPLRYNPLGRMTLAGLAVAVIAAVWRKSDLATQCCLAGLPIPETRVGAGAGDVRVTPQTHTLRDPNGLTA
jgi:hypothetical protein